MDLLIQAKRLALTCLAVAIVLAAAPARAQIFSPGKLAAPHATWDSLQACDLCHTGKSAVEERLCLDCHKPLARLVKAGTGYHARKDVRAKRCETCHTDHKGRDTKMIKWPGGKKEAFPHAEASWPLNGGHAKITCDKCHGLTQLYSSSVSSYLAQHKVTQSYLGLPTACAPCHFDEHRGASVKTCETCHYEQNWKQTAPKFNHEKYWPLKGGHIKTPCLKCHKALKDPAFNAGAYPKPRADSYLLMKPLAKEKCIDCHKDVHLNRYGPDCVSCHTLDNWKVKESQIESMKFHDKTKYPLKDRHRVATCAGCHPEKAGKPHYKPIAFDKCTRCHANSHPDIPAGEIEKWACTRCHNEGGFAPATYPWKEHDKTRFPLREAHQATPCPVCHIKHMGEPLKEPAGQRTAAGLLSAHAISPWRMRAEKVKPETCEACHPTPHRDQFTGQPCQRCHNATRWAVDARFDHDKPAPGAAAAAYPLEATHKKVACVLCHPVEKDGVGQFTRYRPIKKDCASCHPDPHYGQFTKIQPVLECNACHNITSFKVAAFPHDDPRLSDYPLKGRHAPLKCLQCHPKVNLAGQAEAIRYRPLPFDCESCHQDVHKGIYAGVAVTRIERAQPAAGEWSAPEASAGDARAVTSCASCHAETSWKKVNYTHQKSGFRIKGRHARVACASCHKPGVKDPPRDCAGCHQDVHRGKLGADCTECHDEDNFRKTGKFLSRHNRTTFPLSGRHAIVPCRECHQDVRDLGFQSAPRDCAGCHQRNAPGASGALDHSALSTRCESCHTPATWKAATLREHDRCFPINAGHHAGIACSSCHTGRIVKSTGSCSSNSFSCTSCHGCAESRHSRVKGYDCKDRKCYQCHPGG